MVALEHLHADALLFVLFGAALAMFALRATLYFSQRARLARDLAIISPSGLAGRGSLRSSVQTRAPSTKRSGPPHRL